MESHFERKKCRCRDYKERTPFVGIYSKRKPQLLATDPALINSILIKDFKNFAENEYGEMDRFTADPIFGQNPFILAGDEWKNKRSETTPAFTVLRVSKRYTKYNVRQMKM